MENIIDIIIEEAKRYLQRCHRLPNYVCVTEKQFQAYEEEMKLKHKPIVEYNGKRVSIVVRKN